MSIVCGKTLPPTWPAQDSGQSAGAGAWAQILIKSPADAWSVKWV